MQYKSIEEMTLADDFMFYKVMGRPGIAKQFLERLLGKEIKSVVSAVAQSTIKDTVDAHGVRFDVEFVGDSTIYDIEMQQAGGASERGQKELLQRVRFYQSSLDYKYFKQGSEYIDMKPTYVIFICTFDPFGVGCARYTQVPYLKEVGTVVDSGAYAVYLNTTFEIPNVDESILEFLRYIQNPDMANWTLDSFISDVNAAVEDSKVNSDTRRELMSLYEKLRVEREEGRKEEREKNIKAIMRSLQCSYEQALEIIGEGHDGLRKMSLHES